MSLLKVENLKKHFAVKKGLLMRTVGQLKAVDGVSFELKEGETLGLVGESGCGKSTLGRAIIRLYEPTSGEIHFNQENFSTLQGTKLRGARREMQMIFQDPYASLDPRMTVAQILTEPFEIHRLLSKKQRQERVRELASKVGLKEMHLARYPHEFSGGQRQRISIARAIALNPKLIIADEPVSALDVSVQAQILNLMKDLQAQLGLSYLFISHDLGVVEHMCDEIAVMYLGKIVEKAPRGEFFNNPRHPYTQLLLDAVPQMGRDKSRPRKIVKGEVPSPFKPPSGCAFHTRCPFKMEICVRQNPQLAHTEPHHAVACWLYETPKLEPAQPKLAQPR